MNCVEINQELLANANGAENYFKNNILGDVGLWLWWLNQMQSLQWVRKGSLQQKETAMSQLKIKVMLLAFFDWNSIIQYEFVLDGEQQIVKVSITAPEEYCMQEDAWIEEKQTWILHHNKTLGHTSFLIHSYVAKHETSSISYLSYSAAWPYQTFAFIPSYINLQTR